MMHSKEMCPLWEDESGRTRGRGLVNSGAPGLEQKHHLKTVLSSLHHRVKLKRKPKFPEGISQVTKEPLKLGGHIGKKMLDR